ncbi:Short-chain dehydrogenase/reductase 2b [Porphyridium purpureum]|uniref:Short-chain dehydrogenase/reductase 2b n=1 Tax=Porphyridium purpureum TaxID=35688 RepID=A0A5J4YYD0_PORPP|nr:Short-chain dehydrogenase/reductase 2b [Porphyridium purpureum]|eukprot:POR0620..scf209_3
MFGPPHVEPVAFLSPRVVYVVTGALRGIGAELVRQLAGACLSPVVIVAGGRCVEKGKQLQERCRSQSQNAQVVFVPLELREPACVAAFVDRVLADFGVPDVLVNNAGLCLDAPSMDALEQCVRVNADAPSELIEAFLPLMLRRGSGRVVNISSGDGEIAYFASDALSVLTVPRKMSSSESYAGPELDVRQLYEQARRFFFDSARRHGGDVSAELVHGTQPCYKVSKALLNLFSRALIYELEARRSSSVAKAKDSATSSPGELAAAEGLERIQIYCVCPGDVDTDMANDVDQLLDAGSSLLSCAESVSRFLELVLVPPAQSCKPPPPCGFYRDGKRIAW